MGRMSYGRAYLVGEDEVTTLLDVFCSKSKGTGCDVITVLYRCWD